MKNPYIPIYFKWLEDFIQMEYGYKVKISVPYIIAVEDNPKLTTWD
jgi:2-oxo-4-hydroxy-4-carboxy--5-ureidoimidazoline (OHCU) decarboxylase